MWTRLSLLLLISASLPVGADTFTLEQVLAQAIHSNLDLAAAKAGVSLARADELIAAQYANPALSLSASLQPFGKNWDQSTSGGPRQYDALLAIPVDVSGKHSAAKKGAAAATRASEAQLQDTLRKKTLEVRSAFFDLITAEQQLALSKEKQENLQRLVGQIENRTGGKVQPLLLRRAQLALDQAALESMQRESAVRGLRATLAVLMGRTSADTAYTVTSPMKSAAGNLPSVANLVETALAHRPDLNALQMLENKSHADTDLARAQVWDDFIFNLGVTEQAALDARAGGTRLPGATSWGLGVTIPLPTFHSNDGGKAKAAAEVDQSHRQVAALVESIRLEVTTAVDQVQVSEKLIEEYELHQLKRAKEVRDSSIRLFGTGASGFLEYFDAISAYHGTISAYYDALNARHKNVALLNSAVGQDVIK